MLKFFYSKEKLNFFIPREYSHHQGSKYWLSRIYLDIGREEFNTKYDESDYEILNFKPSILSIIKIKEEEKIFQFNLIMTSFEIYKMRNQRNEGSLTSPQSTDSKRLPVDGDL